MINLLFWVFKAHVEHVGCTLESCMCLFAALVMNGAAALTNIAVSRCSDMGVWHC